MFRSGAAVSADVEVPTSFHCNETKIFASGFGTFPNASGYATLDFMGGTDSFLPVFQFNGKTGTVIHSVTAPSIAHTTFHGP